VADKVGGDSVGNDKIGNDRTSAEFGDNASNAVVGNRNRLDSQTGNVVNNYLDRNNPEREKRTERITLDERLDRLEISYIETQKTLNRIQALVDGDKSYRIIGFPDQLAEYINSDKEWKRATEQRILKLEDDSQAEKLTIRPSVLGMAVTIGILLILVVWLASYYLQNSGSRGAIAPITHIIHNITPGVIRGYRHGYF